MYHTNVSFAFLVTHLSLQCYTICIRTEANFCGICYFPTVSTGAAAISQNSFGIRY
jgi:hypothetical protein